VIAVVLVLLLSLYAARRQPAAAVALVFVLATFVWRLVAAAHVGALGETEAEEMSGRLTSHGTAEAFAAAMGLTIAIFFYVLRPSRFRALSERPSDAPSKMLAPAFFTIVVVFLVLLYGDLFRRGVIPLFVGMERFDYAEQYAGSLHHVLFDHGRFACFWLGAFLVQPVLAGRPAAIRFSYPLVAMLAYAFLTGHRFSAFYQFTTFFFMPFAALLIGPSGDRKLAAVALRRMRPLLLAVLALVLLLVLAALINSFTNVRAYDEADSKFAERTLIQPVQLWWATWRRLVEGDWDPAFAAAFMFLNPLVEDRNTGMQYLMVMELGFERANELLLNGQQYTGGYPEVLFELFGMQFGWVATAIAAFVTAWLTRLWLIAFIEGRYLTTLAALYLYFLLTLLMLGGMLNFVLPWTFWVKVAVLVVACVLEPRRKPRSAAVPRRLALG
jgi:hypothetical protein